jgi:hypothetical protein
MTESPPTADTKQPKLRWYQYRLRSLFVLTTLVAILCSWLTVEIQNERKQWSAVQAIEQTGGCVLYQQTRLGKLLGDHSLVTVSEAIFYGAGRRIGPHAMSWLSHSATLISANDGLLVHLRPLHQLQLVALQMTDITDAGLINLEGLSQLRQLQIGNTDVTDAGLAHLRGLQRLEVLHLDGTDVTDNGLVYLRGLNHLRELKLQGTNVTDEGVKKLQQALPKCKIER